MTKSEVIALLVKNPTAPERIYNWQYNQMSIARHYGGLKYMGFYYQIADHEENQPLVRVDVLAREAKEKKDERRGMKQFQAMQAEQAQGSLL